MLLGMKPKIVVTREDIEKRYEGHHPSVIRQAKHLANSHLSKELQTITAPIIEAAFFMLDHIPGNEDLTYGIRQLVMAKDTLVRAALDAFAQSKRDENGD